MKTPADSDIILNETDMKYIQRLQTKTKKDMMYWLNRFEMSVMHLYKALEKAIYPWEREGTLITLREALHHRKIWREALKMKEGVR